MKEFIAYPYQRKNPVKRGSDSKIPAIRIPYQPMLNTIGTWRAMTNATMNALI